MPSQTDQRTADLQEVSALLAQHPRIILAQTEGEPPDCYELEYRLTGLVREEDGSVRRVSRHVVLITLPFGYPHFPPAVKPLTPIFHPDIDPDAARISAQWQQEPSLAKLILHIGEMICGKVYSLEDPFNQEAADWYSEHAAELPLDSLEGGAEPEDFDLGLEDIDLGPTAGAEPEEQGFELSLELEPPQAIEDVASLTAAPAAAELDFEPPQDFDLGLEESAAKTPQDEADFELEIGEPEAALPPEDFGPKLAEIRAHLDRREFFIAGRLLKELPPALPEAEGLRKKVQTAQAQCDQLLQEMKMLEDEDNFPEAQRIFEKLKKVAVDLPGLADIGRRLQQSQSMLDTFSLPEEPAEEEPEKRKKKNGKAGKEPPPPPKAKEKTAVPPPREKKEISTTKSKIVRAARQPVPVAPFAIAAGVAAMIVAGVMLYTRDTNMLLEATLSYQDGQNAVRHNDFQEAQQYVGAAQAKLKTVLLPVPGKGQLKAEIEKLLADEAYQRGIQGEGKYKGQYLPVQEVKDREQLDRLAVQAEVLAAAANFGPAATAYEAASTFAASAASGSLAAEAEQLKELARQLRIKDALSNAKKAEHAGDWKYAEDTYQKALELSESLASADDQSAIRKQMEAMRLHRDLDQSKQNLTSAQWQEAVRILEQAKARLEANPEAATPEQRLEVERLLARSRLHQILSSARQNYDSGNPAAAVQGYKNGLALLDSQTALFDQADRNAAPSIRRTVLMIEIGVELNAAVQAENQRSLTAALRHYRKIEELLNTPDLIKDENLKELEANVRDKFSSLSREAGMKLKMNWLNRNFRRIFSEAYPNSRSADLRSPDLHLIKKSGGQELYKLICIERSRGSSYQLELIYRYDPLSDQWSPCPGCQ
ncbi:ubiquitin-conjugating enzyme E2 [Candidatus Electronema sp. JC]|uniref:ubiquitin-conjugating enzyme E2 n=1 Tax=Candidatus Electronema sp. JC TaxID=3401570 RepID=UPI003B42CD3E